MADSRNTKFIVKGCLWGEAAIRNYRVNFKLGGKAVGHFDVSTSHVGFGAFELSTVA